LFLGLTGGSFLKKKTDTTDATASTDASASASIADTKPSSQLEYSSDVLEDEKSKRD